MKTHIANKPVKFLSLGEGDFFIRARDWEPTKGTAHTVTIWAVEERDGERVGADYKRNLHVEPEDLVYKVTYMEK